MLRLHSLITVFSSVSNNSNDEQVKVSYLCTFRVGFLDPQKRHHESLSEPLLMMPGVHEQMSVCKTFDSAFDGILCSQRK